MLERLLKPPTMNGSAKAPSTINSSLKRPRDETSPVEQKEIAISTPAKNRPSNANDPIKYEPVKNEPITPSTHNSRNNITEFDDDDMDFSMLEDEENQFSQNMEDTSVKKEVKTEPEPTKIEQRDAEQIKADLIKKDNENYAKLLSNWESNFTNENDDDDELLGSIDVEAAQTAITSSVDGKSTMKFWYWDAFEDPMKMPGKIFLFGKMASAENPKEFKSVCVTVEKVERCLYLLPRKYVCITLLQPIVLPLNKISKLLLFKWLL